MTFDDTFLRSEDQQVFGYYDNTSVTQMRTDAFGPGILYAPLPDILKMPMPASSKGFDVETLYNPLMDAELQQCNTTPDSFHD
eukprot:757539-Rhodomonas_salina.2